MEELKNKLKGLILPLKITAWSVAMYWIIKIIVTVVNLYLSLKVSGA